MLSELQCKSENGQLTSPALTEKFRFRSRHGLPDSIQTYGLVSGLWTSTFALGAFIGPSVSGMLYDSIGFRKAVIFIIVLHLVVAGVLALSLVCQKTPHPYKELEASQPLLKAQDSLFLSERS